MFVIAAGFTATFLTSCGEDNKATCSDTMHNGTDTGSHTIPVVNLKISDTLYVTEGTTSGDGKIAVFTKALDTTFVGVLDASNCNKMTLEPITSPRFNINDSTYVENLSADGTATVNGNNISTSITLQSGVIKTTQSSLSALNNLNLGSLPIKFTVTGTFIKL